MRILKSLAFVIVLFSLMFGQQEKIKILDVNIEGIALTDSMTILINSGLMPGKSVSGEDIQKGVKNLWALKLYDDVKIFIEQQNLNGVVLKIKVKEYPKLVDYRIEGRDKVDKSDIKSNIDLYKGGIYTPYRAYKTINNIKKLYRDEGYLLAQVSVDTTHITSNKISAIIKIDEGKKVQVKKIRFHNNEILTEKKLKKQFKEIKEDRWWRGADFDPKKYEEDKEKIIIFCQKEGFRDASILRDSLSYNDEKDALYIDLWIEEGTQYYFGNVKFDGNTIFTAEELNNEVLFEKGDVYNLEEFEKTINEKIKAKYYNEGYLFAQIQPVETPRGKDTVDIAFNITESKVVRINQIRVTGNSRTNEKVVRRELTILPGDIFNQSQIERSMQEVWMLNYFANVVPDVKFIQGNDDFVDLEFAVEEKNTDQANASIGYSAYEGPIGNLGFSFTNFSIKKPFRIGDGQKLSLQWYFGKYYKSYSLSFTEPWMFNTPTLGGFSVFNRQSGGGGLYTFEMREKGGSITLGREFKWPDNFFRGQWTLRFADVDVEGSSSYVYYGNKNSQQMSFSQVIFRDSRNRPEFPTAGSVNSVLMKLAGGPLGGTEDFLKFRLTSEWYIPTYGGLVFYLNNQLGFLHEIESGTYINPGEKFFIGGSGMGFAEGLRGYQERFTAPNGGLAMGKFTAELRFPIAPNPTIFGLFFLEGGNVWDRFSDTDLLDLYRSAGVGVRLFMPMVGIIGVDFGYGFDRREGLIPENKGKWEVHFQFGKF